MKLGRPSTGLNPEVTSFWAPLVLTSINSLAVVAAESTCDANAVQSPEDFRHTARETLAFVTQVHTSVHSAILHPDTKDRGEELIFETLGAWDRYIQSVTEVSNGWWKKLAGFAETKKVSTHTFNEWLAIAGQKLGAKNNHVQIPLINPGKFVLDANDVRQESRCELAGQLEDGWVEIDPPMGECPNALILHTDRLPDIPLGIRITHQRSRHQYDTYHFYPTYLASPDKSFHRAAKNKGLRWQDLGSMRIVDVETKPEVLKDRDFTAKLADYTIFASYCRQNAKNDHLTFVENHFDASCSQLDSDLNFDASCSQLNFDDDFEHIPVDQKE